MNAVTETEAWSKGKAGEVRLNPVRLVDGARSILRTIQRFAGATLVLAALGLWVTPGANWAMDVALFKLSLSLAMGFSGLALWQMGTGCAHFEIELDTDAGEVRLTQMIHGRMRPVVRCRFNELARIEQDGDVLRLWDGSGTYIAEVEMCEPSARAKLLEAFRYAGQDLR